MSQPVLRQAIQQENKLLLQTILSTALCADEVEGYSILRSAFKTLRNGGIVYVPDVRDGVNFAFTVGADVRLRTLSQVWLLLNECAGAAANIDPQGDLHDVVRIEDVTGPFKCTLSVIGYRIGRCSFDHDKMERALNAGIGESTRWSVDSARKFPRSVALLVERN